MTKTWRVALVIVALIAAAWTVGRAQAQVGQFRIVIEPSATGVKAVCISGCAWKELSWDCDKARPCKAEIDQLGVGGAQSK
jgi:hypothetical protein